ncbi:MAG TPA: helix-turn-helix transcriptional regulator, partial [Candidatus Eremiobacteraceae bacterium]|nr:helix-turn-helix transcriptional regulator [Candidatus Eremiobacteraceae bacterium]
VRILHRRYVGEDAQRKASLQEERVNAEVARTIYELREQAGLSQKELAERVDTTQSVISRLEDADYEGHSLSMLNRIAKALNQQVQVVMRPKEQKQASITLAVAKGVVREVNAGRTFQRQIAIRGGSPQLLAAIRKASARNRIAVAVNGVFGLSVGDTGAIWEKHQAPGRQAEDFTSLFDLLSRRPEQPVTFSWFDPAE